MSRSQLFDTGPPHHWLTCPKEHSLYLDSVSSSLRPPGSGEDFQKQVDAFAAGEGIREPRAPGRRDHWDMGPGLAQRDLPKVSFYWI